MLALSIASAASKKRTCIMHLRIRPIYPSPPADPIDVSTAVTSRKQCPDDVVRLTSYEVGGAACAAGRYLDGCQDTGVLKANCTTQILFSGMQ